MTGNQMSTKRSPDVRKQGHDLDLIEAQPLESIAHIFRERVRRTPENIAVKDYDFVDNVWRDYTWRELEVQAIRWQAVFRQCGLQSGDRVAIRLRNCRHWLAFDQAALGLGLVVVPLYTADRADNCAYVLSHSESRLLLVENTQMWQDMATARDDFSCVEHIFVLEADGLEALPDLNQVSSLASVIDEADDVQSNATLITDVADANTLASIVYTSGTTGRPKGVMLSHRNMMANCDSGTASFAVFPTDVFLSFLPLSHTLERTVGYYVPVMAGSMIAYARSIPDLPDDLKTIRPTMLISVPRIFERVYGKIQDGLEQSALKKKLFNMAVAVGWDRFEYQQGRGPKTGRMLLWPLLDKLVSGKLAAGLGGRLRGAVSGGAPLPKAVGVAFNALGIPIYQGYGLTETSPSLTINTPSHNIPWSIGLPLYGVDLKIGENDELLAKGDNVSLGYWRNDEATAELIDADGWLHTGDCARVDEDGFYFITGRIKDIIVLSNGEKVPPADMESAIARDALFEQIMIVGEGRSFLSVMVVLNPDIWKRVATTLGVDDKDESVLSDPGVQETLLKRVKAEIAEFPGYARIHKITPTLEPWTVENGLTTPTLKIKRPAMRERFSKEIEAMYDGH